MYADFGAGATNNNTTVGASPTAPATSYRSETLGGPIRHCIGHSYELSEPYERSDMLVLHTDR